MAGRKAENNKKNGWGRMKVLKILSLFTGAGGLDLGFLMAEHPEFKFKIVWANDNFEPAIKTLHKNKRYFDDDVIIDSNDVWKIDFNNVPNCDGIIAGFPCQDFSVLSKRRGINVQRGQLYTRIVDVLRVKKPLFFVAENVKGLMSANKGEAIKIIGHEFENPDGVEYKVRYDVINFANFGVPQLRKRVIFVGFRSDLGIKFEFPEGKFKNNPRTVEWAFNNPIDVRKVRFNNEKHKMRERTVKILKAIPPGGNYKDLKGKIDKDGKSLYVKGLMSNIYRRLRPKEPAYTVIARGGGGTWGYHHEEPRPLTNRERARLQTFPDDFEFIGNIGEVRTLIGNAVPPTGAKVIAESILKIIGNKI